MENRIVPLLDLKAQYTTIEHEIVPALEKVLKSQYFILGPEVENLEKEIAAYCKAQHAIGVSSGTDALLIALMALDVGPGDEVITTPFTFFATVGSILRLGAIPVLADIRPDTFNIDETQIEKLISNRTKAIIPVHLFGQCAEMNTILELARKNNIPVIEDAAQAIGAEFESMPAGSMGTAACFSFFPSKNLGAYGEGGMITTNDKDLAAKIRILRNQGSDPKYYHKYLGGNFRLDAIQAAVLRVKLPHLEQWTNSRRNNAAFYNKHIAAKEFLRNKVKTPIVVRERHVFNQYVIQCERRDQLREHLQNFGVSTEIYYPVPMHLQECWSGKYKKGDFPVAEKCADSVLALPIYPELTDSDKQYVIDCIDTFYSVVKAD